MKIFKFCAPLILSIISLVSSYSCTGLIDTTTKTKVNDKSDYPSGLYEGRIWGISVSVEFKKNNILITNDSQNGEHSYNYRIIDEGKNIFVVDAKSGRGQTWRYEFNKYFNRVSINGIDYTK